MKEEEGKRFFEFLEGCGLIYGKEVKDAQAEIFFNVLKDYSFDAVEKSFNTHIKTSKFFPTPADIIGNIAKPMNSHIGADEAWQVALNAMDEASSVIVNNEILQARECAMNIYYSGDKVGARMAFRDSYNRITLQSPMPTWFVSLGHDKDGRDYVKAKFEGMKLLERQRQNGFIDNPLDLVNQGISNEP